MRNDNLYTTVITEAIYRNEAGLLSGYNYGSIRHGSATDVTDPLKYGFLSLGELANVYGFDSPLLNPSTPGDPSTILYRPLGPIGAVFSPTSSRPSV